MATAGAKKSRRKPADMDDLKSEVASFASSLGLASSAGVASGFDDSDFRKTGAMKPPKPDSEAPIPEPPRGGSGEGERTVKPPRGRAVKPNPLEHVDPFGGDDGPVGKVAKGKLPLMRATTPMGLWYEELGELEARVLTGADQRTIPVMGLEKLKRLVESKKELAERLMAQYAEDYEARTRRHGDWHLVRMAAKSGTTNDKVTALATLVGDNPIANLKSLDILLGEFVSNCLSWAYLAESSFQ